MPYKAEDWINAFKNSARGIEIAAVLVSEGFAVREIIDAFFNARYVVGLIGPDQSRLHVSNTPLSNLAVLVIGADPYHHPGLVLPVHLQHI